MNVKTAFTGNERRQKRCEFLKNLILGTHYIWGWMCWQATTGSVPDLRASSSCLAQIWPRIGTFSVTKMTQVYACEINDVVEFMRSNLPRRMISLCKPCQYWILVEHITERARSKPSKAVQLHHLGVSKIRVNTHKKCGFCRKWSF
jgi:hypothetical protein